MVRRGNWSRNDVLRDIGCLRVVISMLRFLEDEIIPRMNDKRVDIELVCDGVSVILDRCSELRLSQYDTIIHLREDILIDDRINDPIRVMISGIISKFLLKVG